jgi:hypothetical protein
MAAVCRLLLEFRRVLRVHRILFAFLAVQFATRILAAQELPAEIFNDVIENMRMAQTLSTTGVNLNMWLNGADGPLLAHLAYFPLRVIGFEYTTMKYVTAACGVVIVACAYGISWGIWKDKLQAMFAAWLVGYSFWNLSQSVAAKPHAVSAIMAAIVVLLYVHKRYVLAGLAAALGMYSQISFWPMSMFTLTHPLMFAVFSVASLPFVKYVLANKDILFHGTSYTGEKLAGLQQPWYEVAHSVGENLIKQTRALYVYGDVNFRHNASGSPHVDSVTALLFTLGVMLIIWAVVKGRKRYFRLVFTALALPFILTQLLAAIDIRHQDAVPNIGRTAGMMTFVGIIAGYGARRTYNVLSKRFAPIYAQGALACVLILVTVLNYHTFFIIYPRTLPNGNVSFSRAIAHELKKFSSFSRMVIVDCCWGDWGQPEPLSVAFTDKTLAAVEYVRTDHLEHVCDWAMVNGSGSVVMVTRPRTPMDTLPASCMNFSKTTITASNVDVADMLHW